LTIALDDAYRVTLDIDDQPRHYRLLVPPPGLDGQLTVRLISATTIVPPDTRAIGLRVEELTLHALGESAVWPAPGQLLPPAALLATVAWMLWRLRWRAESIAGGLVVAGGLLLLVQRLTPGAIAPMYVARISGAAVVLAALTALVLPALERRGAAWGAGTVRALWAAALLACAARLFGTLYPPFDAYDLSLNLGRFVRTVGGALVDTNRSFEFRSGVTVYPAGPYLALMPGVLLGLTPKLAVQGGIALVDGLGALATGWLALRLGLGSRTAIFGAVLYAGLPVMLTSLWFGHTAQVFGQALMVPLALALLAALERDQAGAWLAAAALLSMALLSHIGVTVLAVAWLGMAWLAVGRGLPQRTWWRFFLILAAACTVGLALVYGPAASRARRTRSGRPARSDCTPARRRP
jgi:hypothetical protein